MLVTVATYRSLTGDEDTAASAVSARIEEATELLEDRLGRPLAEAVRTEFPWRDNDGNLYPLATPILAADGWTIDGDALIGSGFPTSTTVVPDTTAPAVPTGLTAEPGDGEVVLDWDANVEDDLDRYEYRVDGGNPVSTVLVSGATVTALTNDAEYDFEVRAVDTSDNASAWSTVIAATPTAPVVIDSFATAETLGPRYAWAGGDGLHLQAWNPPFKHGVKFTPTVDVMLHGVRWWRPGLESGVPVVHDLFLNVGSPTDYWEPADERIEINTDEWTADPGWQTLLFAEPVLCVADVPRLAWINIITSDGDVDVLFGRTEDYWTTPTASPGGLMTTVSPESARYSVGYDPGNPDYLHVNNPNVGVNVWYWIDPLVSEAP